MFEQHNWRRANESERPKDMNVGVSERSVKCLLSLHSFVSFTASNAAHSFNVCEVLHKLNIRRERGG
jgi:hypothetical protein